MDRVEFVTIPDGMDVTYMTVEPTPTDWFSLIPDVWNKIDTFVWIPVGATWTNVFPTEAIGISWMEPTLILLPTITSLTLFT